MAVLDPALGAAATWVYDYDATEESVAYTGASWMGETSEPGGLGLAYLESFLGKPMSDFDNDVDDSYAVRVNFDPELPLDLDHFGYLIAVDADNAGVEIAGGQAFYRVDEKADNRDWNDDGDKKDMVLVHHDLTGKFLGAVGTLNDLEQPAILTGGPGDEVGVAFLSDEAMAKKDLNKDGDKEDLVLQYALLDS